MDLERKIVDTAKKAADMGFGLSKTQLKAKTGRIVKSLKLKIGFKKDTPGDDWFIGLKKRHPDVKMKKPQKLSVTRAKAMNRDKVNSYFALLKGTLDKLKVQPDHIWNCDRLICNWNINQHQLWEEKVVGFLEGLLIAKKVSLYLVVEMLVAKSCLPW